ncbi:Lysophospholipase L1 [Pelosinus fermentans]|uniref:Lipolytic protein G-D-S-L family n=1 Tax=Pelosinus fermentans B4 TaxID=1149862 RepID=I9LI84_9FIRM|nr:lipolytic protein G-D-S-L family [Pelosinus fermentans B4]EIW25938.1 lipolytic protein G-D-S-L family [Pelosinus fermentans A11]OAM93236.1 lipolytic enzyme [Pelosinus fermentans DSM 17108]SDQ71235.1 Lysophospholipase L1 [Pelosinus fermentans]
MRVLRILFLSIALFLVTVNGYAQNDKIQLVWHNAEDAVMYELEIANRPIKNNKKASAKQFVYSTTKISTPGIELDAALFKGEKLKKLYYRVRPLDFDKNPRAAFSDPIPLSEGVLNPVKPTITSSLKKSHPLPLYPVYSWIPVLGADSYEVEILSALPENPNGVEASKYRIRSSIVQGGFGFDYYDTHAYVEPGTFYWRVLALDENQKPIGKYSDASPLTVKIGSQKWAVFGDSITHGGGAISNPPSDERFEYVSYLPFPVKNLGRSGDTSEAMVERFEHDVLPFKPQYLFIMGGTNSIRGGVSGEVVIESLESLKKKCEENGITPIFLTVPPVNPERIQRVFDQSTADNWQVELAKVNAFIRNQSYAIEIYSLLADEDGILPVKYAQDGLHPDISGKKVMADSIKNFLKNHPEL